MTALKRITSSDHVKSNILQWEPRHSIIITDLGKRVAEHIEQHHHVFELLLHDFLGLTKEEAHHESSEIGSSISCMVTKAIIKKLKIESWEKKCICPESGHLCSYENRT